jgi:hypothetical protein
MKEQIIKLLKENSLGKSTAVLDNMDMGFYIWRKDLFVLKDGWDYEWNELDESEQSKALSEIEKGNYIKSKSYQG